MTAYVAASETSIQQAGNILERLVSSFFSSESLLVLAISLSMAFVLGRIIAAVLRRVVAAIGTRADKIENLQAVNRLRRQETIIILSIAIIRTMLVLFALYFWWIYIHPQQQPTALIGASALFAIILGGALSPALRDIANGSSMMAEQWYGVGDHVRLEPFVDMQGVVERVTLRSTRIRDLNGEIIWVNNQNIQAVRITPKGIRTIAIELFVNDLAKGDDLIRFTNRRLPAGSLLVISPLAVMTTAEVGDASWPLWHLTAIAETAPGREWLIEKYAIEVMKDIDESGEKRILRTDPIARYADSEAEIRFARALHNARKTPKIKRSRQKNKKPPSS